MSGLINLEVHHHGVFSPQPLCYYIGGKCDVIYNVDVDTLCFRDLEDWAALYKYDRKNLVYFKSNGHDFSDGVRVLYDDVFIRDMVNLCTPYDKLQVYVDSSLADDVLEGHHDQGYTRGNEDQDNDGGNDIEHDMGNKDLDDILRHYEVELGSGDESDHEYKYDSDRETEELDSGASDVNDGSDEEFVKNKENYKTIKDGMREWDYSESDFDSDELRSIGSSSEDENNKIGYVGPPVIRNKRRRQVVGMTSLNRKGRIKWEVGMEFVNMDEFRKLVREYGIKERRAVKLHANDVNRCQVKCEPGCPFYIWVRKKRDSDMVEIRTLITDHLCTKPYKNKLASVKYLVEQYGERIRKNPTWKVKELIETIRQEMEIEIPWIKAMRLRKAALDGVHDSLKQHYSKIWDFGHEVLKTNPNNTVKIYGTRLNENDVNRFKRMYICYSALKKGWKVGCRPVIGLDGCFLKTVCGGQLLSAVGRDGNNQMYPICHAVVEVESTDSWRWFTELMKEDLELGDGSGLTIISDQQKVCI